MTPPRHLIVVVPGIGGSVLTAPDGTSPWDLQPGAIIRAAIDSELLDLDRELTPTRLVDDLAVLRPWLVVPGYGGLTQLLRTRFGVGLRVHDYQTGMPVPSGLDVLRVPYDFRRSVAEAAEVVGRAVTAAVGDSGRRVIVVAHSLGGLVARYWIGPGRGWRHCRALITLGTPHRGAPRALDWLVNGARIGPLRLPSVTNVLRRWPAVHELLPQYPAVLTAGGGPVEIDALAPELVRPFGTPCAGADLLRRFGEASAVHDAITRGWAEIPHPERPSLQVYFGRGHRTLSRAVVREGRLRVDKTDPEWRPNVGWFGDGTVPAIAAIPTELSERPEAAQAVADKHGPMGSTGAVLEKLDTLQGEPLPDRGTDRPSMPWIGWDVDDEILAGRECPVGASVYHGADGPGDVDGRAATLVLTGGGRQVPLPMQHSETGWRTVLPPLPEGVYQLDVEVKDAWNGASLFAVTPLAVLDAPMDAKP